MGAKNSKSANITSPKKEALPVEGENHVNGDAGNKGDIIKDGNNINNHVIEVSKEEVKELVKELAQEAANEVKEKEAAKEKEIQKIEEKENQTPPPAKESPEEKTEKKKVKKRFSIRSLSFLRKEKKVKEDKHKNGDVTVSPEKKDEMAKEEEVPKLVEEGQGDAAKATTPAAVDEVKPEETKEEVKEEEKKVEEEVVVAEKVDEPKLEEPKKEVVKIEEVLTAVTEAMGNVEISSEPITITKEVSETHFEKKPELTVESEVITNSAKEIVSEVIAATENGIGENHSEEIVAN